MPQESQIQDNDYRPKVPKPIYDGINEVYLNQAGDTNQNYGYFERTIHPISKMTYSVANEISEARKRRLETQFFTNVNNQRGFVGSVAKAILGRELSSYRLEPLTEDILKQEESVVGSSLFPISRKGEHITFFNDTTESWFFNQTIVDENNNVYKVTFHYEVHHNGILKISSNSNTPNQFISGQELDNFALAVKGYHVGVMNQIYNQDYFSGNKVA